MSFDENADIENLKPYVEALEGMAVAAETQLSLLSEDNLPDQDIEKVLVEYQQVQADASLIHTALLKWQELALSAVEKSEVTYALGRMKRLQVVIKNILRISRAECGLIDFEQLQDEMNLNLTMDKFQ